MNKWRIIFIATIVLFHLLPATAQFKDDPINLSLTDLELPTGFEELGVEVVFNFHVTLNIFNPNSKEVTIAHTDTCGFKISFVNITSEIEGYDYQPYACGQAITDIEYVSGLSTFDLSAGILFKENVTKLPVGNYYLAPFLPNWGQDQFSQIYGVTILVSEGGVDIIYDSQLPSFSEPEIVPININLVLISILSFGLIWRKINRKRI